LDVHSHAAPNFYLSLATQLQLLSLSVPHPCCRSLRLSHSLTAAAAAPHNFRTTHDNNGATSPHECHLFESKSPSPSLVHLHHHHQQRRERQQQLQRRYRIKSSELDEFTTMHFSPPSKSSINTDFTNVNVVSEASRGGGSGGSGNSLSHRQSLIGEYGDVHDEEDFIVPARCGGDDDVRGWR
jgi:hypothetical protein